MANTPREFYVVKELQYLASSNGEYPAYFNDRGDYVTLMEASFLSAHAITGSTVNYQSVALHLVTSGWTHTTSLASYDFNAASKTATQYVGVDVTLSGTTADLVIADGAGINVYEAVSGTNTTISTGSIIQFRLREGCAA